MHIQGIMIFLSFFAVFTNKIKAQTEAGDYEYYTLELLTIKNKSIEDILYRYVLWWEQNISDADCIIIMELSHNNFDSNFTETKAKNYYLRIRSISDSNVKYDGFSGFFYYKVWDERFLVLVKYTDGKKDGIMQMGNHMLQNYEISRTGLFECTGKTNQARFHRTRQGKITHPDRSRTSCVFEYNMDTKMFKFLWRQFYLGR